VPPLSKRVAVISDVHGNQHALDAVLAAIVSHEPDELWCLGDLVGYGPRPNECCAEIEARADLCLAGNHDLVVLGSLDLRHFAGDAAAAASWTQTVLEPQHRSFLAGLKSAATRPGAALFHGSARDPVWDYVLDEDAARATFYSTIEPLVLVGHSHVPLAISLVGDVLAGGVAQAGTEVSLDAHRWLLNPGSVGQPRDGDPRAAYLVVDAGRRAVFHRVEYPINRTQAEMLERGLPAALIGRLAHGV
jgi:predicted phosphodiesterase